MKTNYQQANKIKALIKDNCCNCFQGDCILLDVACPQMGCITSVLCKHCITSIIPIDMELHKELLPDVSGIYQKNCKLCRKAFTSESKTDQYCPECKKKARSNRNKKYYQKSIN